MCSFSFKARGLLTTEGTHLRNRAFSYMEPKRGWENCIKPRISTPREVATILWPMKHRTPQDWGKTPQCHEITYFLSVKKWITFKTVEHLNNPWRIEVCCRVETECDGTRKRTGGEVKGKKANGGGSQQSCTVSDMVYPALLPLMRTPRLPAADWTDTPADINGLVRFAERPNLVSARVPPHSVFTLPGITPGVKAASA